MPVLLFDLAMAGGPEVTAAVGPEPAPRPRWHQLPSDPRAQTDYTAYTLEWGEVRIGLGGAGFGVLPGVQLTTQPILDLAGMTNLSLKVDPLQAGPLDVGGNAALGHIKSPAINAVYVTAGLNGSLIVAPAWSLHAGGQWLYSAAIGVPDVRGLSDLFPAIGHLSDATIDALEQRFAYEIRVETVVLSAATDIRFNRRDSIVLQGRTAVWAWTELPPILLGYGTEDRGFLPLDETWSASIAWQFHWRNVDLRFGIGTSTVPGAWATETFDLAWRFGGKNRFEQKRRLRAWRGLPPLKAPFGGAEVSDG